MKILIIDNYDSFTHNLSQQLTFLSGSRPRVVKNDALTLAEFHRANPQLVVISPGPGHPQRVADFGICSQILHTFPGPLLGVCLGFQGLVCAAGGRIVHAKEPYHGRASSLTHCGGPLFSGIPQGIDVVRYHSLVAVSPLPIDLEPLAFSDGYIMAARHRKRPHWGLQFHPESIATEFGDKIIANFLSNIGISRPLKIALEASCSRDEVNSRAPAYSVRQSNSFADPELVYRNCYADSSNNFWLDSSQFLQGRARFSVMGDASGSQAQVIRWFQKQQRLELENQDGNTQSRQHIFDYLDDFLTRNRRKNQINWPFPMQGGLVGYFGYELREGETQHVAVTPDAAWIFPERYLVFDHEGKKVFLVSLASEDTETWFEKMLQKLTNLSDQDLVTSEMDTSLPSYTWSRDLPDYLNDIHECLEKIRDGESYEICLTNRLFLDEPVDPLATYAQLRHLNPAPYAACLRFGDQWVLSSSPEQFLKITHEGDVSSKPIKGTRARHPDPETDKKIARELATCIKDRAENLMIVDLLRNDLGRVCQSASVKVPVLMAVEGYATVHQLVSTVVGKLKPSENVLSCIRAAFPGGSMTGAPKTRTMAIIDKLERDPRGVYSGCIGYLSLDGAADLSVVIRTLVISGGRASIGTGGAIVSLSDPAHELAEMELKAEVLLRAAQVVPASTFSST